MPPDSNTTAQEEYPVPLIPEDFFRTGVHMKNGRENGGCDSVVGRV